jgi:predicted RNA-binding protein YlxR (DUF448 family)
MNKVIIRTCIVTRKALYREEMFRVVKTPNHEIKIDSTYKAQGRGCYISKDKDIILLAKKKSLIEKHLKVSDCKTIYDELLKQF